MTMKTSLKDTLLALRKAGAVYVDVTDGGGITVEFEGVPAKKRRRRTDQDDAAADVRQSEIDFSADVVPTLSEAQRAALLDQLQNEYLP